MFGIRDINTCGMQVAPGLYKWVDLPDLQGLIAPAPLLVDTGANDTCFKVDTALKCHQRLRAIYQAARAGKRLALDFHPSEHGWGGNRSEAFFNKHLQPLTPPRRGRHGQKTCPHSRPACPGQPGGRCPELLPPQIVNLGQNLATCSAIHLDGIGSRLEGDKDGGVE